VAYLLKDCAAEELVKAVREVAGGKRYISSDIATLLMEDYAVQERPAKPDEAALNPRETELLRLLAEGLSVREIAERLQVSIRTIERSRAQLMEKLKLFSVVDLIKYAVRNGIAPLN
jgi:DNA-binding NarL/FixJ family response regulator